MPEKVLFDVADGGVATITLNRPDRLNAIDMAMRDLLWEYIGACAEIPGLQALVFRGAGRAFSAGADITEFGTAPSVMDSRRARHDRDVWLRLLELPVPTVAVMHGFCYGAGLELPLCCDYRLAAAGTLFALPEVTLGYMPSACATQTLPRTAPPAIAAALVLAGEPIGTDDALLWGIVDAVAGAPSVEASLHSLLQGLDSPRARDRFMARRRSLFEPRIAAVR